MTDTTQWQIVIGLFTGMVAGILSGLLTGLLTNQVFYNKRVRRDVIQRKARLQDIYETLSEHIHEFKRHTNKIIETGSDMDDATSKQRWAEENNLFIDRFVSRFKQEKFYTLDVDKKVRIQLNKITLHSDAIHFYSDESLEILNMSYKKYFRYDEGEDELVQDGIDLMIESVHMLECYVNNAAGRL